MIGLLTLLAQLAVADGTTVATTPPHHIPTPRDSAQLANAATTYGVPVLVMLGAAIAESGLRGGNDALGPGIADSTGTRVCREVGRMQVNPCDHWSRLTPACARAAVSYDSNISCGAAVLRYKFELCSAKGEPTWECAVRTYNGRGPMAERHAERVRRIIGQLVLSSS